MQTSGSFYSGAAGYVAFSKLFNNGSSLTQACFSPGASDSSSSFSTPTFREVGHDNCTLSAAARSAMDLVC